MKFGVIKRRFREEENERKKGGKKERLCLRERGLSMFRNKCLLKENLCV